MISNAAAYYLWPTVWVGSKPPASGTDVDVTSLEEEVYRTTLSVGIAAKVLREGLFVFDFSDWPPGRGLPEDNSFDFDAAASVVLQRVAVLNAHLACLYTTVGRRQKYGLEKMVVSPSDLILSRTLDAQNVSFADLRVAALALARYPTTYRIDLPTLFDWRIASRNLVIETDTVEESFDLLSNVLEHPTLDALLITDLLMRSCKAYEDHNYSLCLVTAWAIAEKLLQRLWERYLEANRQRQIDGSEVSFINQSRKKKLTESRDFNASVISEVLSLVDYLPAPLYRDMTKVRQARNDWVHGLEPVSRETAALSVSVAEEMLRLVDSLDLEVRLSSRLSF